MDPSAAICIEELTKVFGQRKKIRAVHNVTLEIAPGQVYGFLGPNGAGKTTTIRMLLNLMRPTAGRLFIFGQDIHESPAILRRIGAHVEGAAFYPYLSGRRNLEVIGRINGFYDANYFDALLRQVGLSERARQRVRGYSLGMKQRLGLAAALLNHPDLLIMDEPTNGLDPAGIQEMRAFMRELVDEHDKTVFFSSHLLSEVEQICDRVAVIHHGEILREGAVKTLLQTTGSVRIEAEPLTDAAAILDGRWPSQIEDGALTVQAPRDAIPAVLDCLYRGGVSVYEVTREKQTLEAFFLSVTNDGASQSVPKEPAEHAQ